MTRTSWCPSGPLISSTRAHARVAAEHGHLFVSEAGTSPSRPLRASVAATIQDLMAWACPTKYLFIACSP